MKLFITPTSPYARLARAVIIEKGLGARIDINLAKTRTTDSPYYTINPSGRVPCLILDDGTTIEESALICDYLDHLDGAPSLTPQGETAFEAKRLEAMARSMMDGIGVWGREFAYRPPELRSGFIIDHETARAYRMADEFEHAVEKPEMTDPVNMAQLTLACLLDARENSPPGFNWRAGRSQLAAWVDRMGNRPSIKDTRPTKS
ncbi:MAG: glutathione S-transferase [Alphaproteobacteria bacterium]|jgi:glutathione S-transferase